MSALKFGDPDSIAKRDAARICNDCDKHPCECEKTVTCDTCDGQGEVEAHVSCQNANCTHGGSYHCVVADCPCCEGSGEIDVKKK